MQSINGSHIVLIPKKEDSVLVNDYKPIFLLNTSVKIITKRLIGSISYFLNWSMPINMGLLKADPYKTGFDKIEHNAIMEIMP